MESLLDYLDELEEVIDNSKSMPFSSKASIDKEKLFDIISEIRLNLPDEIRQAQRIIDDYDKIINDAKSKANHIIKEAEVSSKELTNTSEIYKKAQDQASELLDEAKKDARDMRVNALDYADEILQKTEDIVKETVVYINENHNQVRTYLDKVADTLYQNRQELRNGN